MQVGNVPTVELFQTCPLVTMLRMGTWNVRDEGNAIGKTARVCATVAQKDKHAVN